MARLPLLSAFLILVSYVIAPVGLQAQYHDWTGAVSTEWNDEANWNPQVIPDSTSFVRINSVASDRYPVLSSSVKVNYFRLYSYQVTIGTHTLEADGMDTVGGTIITTGGKLKVTGIDALYNTYILGSIIIEIEYGRLFGITYDGDVTMHITSKTNEYGWWPRNSGVYISYNGDDIFKGRAKFIVDGVGDLNIGTYATTTLFEKQVDFILSNPGPEQTRVYFSQRGGTSIFKDSVNIFLTPRTEFRPKSFVDFEGVVSINNQGGIFKVMHYDDYTSNPSGNPKSSLIRFRKSIVIDQTQGEVSLGSSHSTVFQGTTYASSSGSVIDTLSSIILDGAGFSRGNLNITNTIVHSPNTDLLAFSHPDSTVAITGTTFNNSTVNGSIHVKADDIISTSTTFNGRVVLNRDGYAANADGAGGNIFHKPVELINSAGYDWSFGSNYRDTFKDSVRIVMNGNGQRQIPGDSRGAVFKIGSLNGSDFEGPIRLESGLDSNQIHIGSFGQTEFLDAVDISNFKSGDIVFYNSKFRGAALSRTLVSSHPKMRLLLKDECLFEGPLSVQVPRIGSDFTTFLKPVTIQKTGADDDYSLGGNTFHQRVRFLNAAGAGQLHLLSGEDKLIK